MPVTTECACGKRLKAEDKAAGRTAKCPNCGQPVTFPSLAPSGDENPFENPLWQRPPETVQQSHAPEPPPLPKAEWHYSQDGQKQGPASFDSVQQLVKSGRLKPTDLVWKDGMPDWLPVDQVLEFSPKPRRQPPKKLFVFVGVALTLVVMVAGFMYFGNRREDPIYAGKRLATWIAQLKDADIGSKQEALEAIQGLGVSAYTALPDLIGILENTTDAELVLKTIGVIQTIVNEALVPNSKLDEKMVADAREEIGSMSPRVDRYFENANKQKTETTASLDRVNSSGEGTGVYGEGLIQRNKDLGRIIDKMWHLPKSMKTASELKN